MPQPLLHEIEGERAACNKEMVWHYLKVPKAHRKAGVSIPYDQQFSAILQQYGYGRNIPVDRVMVWRPSQGEFVHQVTIIRDNNTVYLPYPYYYV